MQIEMTIKGLMVDPITNMPIVILRDKDGQKVLPIWVGIFEANAIALQIENVATPRPMTHDLLRNVIQDLKASVQKIVVCDLQENTFYALIYLVAATATRWPSTRGRATRSRWRCGRGRRSSSRTSVIDNAKTVDLSTDKRRRRPPAQVAREPRPGRPRQVQDVIAQRRVARTAAPQMVIARVGELPNLQTRQLSNPPGHQLSVTIRSSIPGPPQLMIVAIANQKGGVGKTTTAINLAAALALRGTRTLLIDLDPQANSTMSFLDIAHVSRSVYDAIADPAVAIEDVILPSPIENLSIAPSRIALAKLEAKLVGEMDAHFRLKDKLEPVLQDLSAHRHRLPADAGPADGQRAGRRDAPAHPDPVVVLRARGTDDLLETIEKVRARPNPALRILGVVITMHDKRTALARDIRTQIQKVFGGKVFKTVITKSVRLEESPAYKESIFTFAPDSTGATEYYRLCEEVIDRA